MRLALPHKSLLLAILLAPLAVSPAAAGDTPPGAPVTDARLSAPLTVPDSGEIKVAFLISSDAELVDFAGPWGVFQYVTVQSGGKNRNPFKLYTVATGRQPVTVSGGMRIVPNYSLKTAPTPDIVVVPALDIEKLSPKALSWLRKVQNQATLTMSVCNGSFVLGKAGLLDGKRITSHHEAYGALRGVAPGVTVIRGVRYVEDGTIATSGGLTSGTDLALRTVERYFGRDIAKQTARDLEYLGSGWMYPESNAIHVPAKPIAKEGEAIDPVCEVAVSRETAPTFEHQGKTYYFNCTWCREQFVAHPERFNEPP